MSSRERRGGHNRPLTGAFSAGLVCLFLATLLNVAHDRLGWSEGRDPPPGLDVIYAAAGKFGVTLLLSTLGLAIMGLGVAFHFGRRRAAGRHDQFPAAPEVPYYSATSTDSSVALPGRTVLTTGKYLPAPAALSGVPGLTGMQRRRPEQ